MTVDAFSHTPTTKLSRSDSRRLIRLAKSGAYHKIFPTGSSKAPTLMVGRSEQMAKINHLINELLDSPDEGSTIHCVVMYGPRGVGKTAMINEVVAWIDAQAPDKSIQRLRLTDQHLSQPGGLLNLLTAHHQTATTTVKKRKFGASAGVAKGEIQTHATHAKMPNANHDLSRELRRYCQIDAKHIPTLITIDEAHNAHPAELGALLSITQDFNAKGGTPIALMMAGTPDVINVLKQTDQTWFFDRSSQKRRVPTGNLTDSEVHTAISVPLQTIGVEYDESALLNAVAWCKGSPYFTQELGYTALAQSQKQPGQWTTDFSAYGSVHLEYEKAITARYEEVYGDLHRENMISCVRQLGALWRLCQERGIDKLHQDIIEMAIASGSETPMSIRRPAPRPTQMPRLPEPLGHSLVPIRVTARPMGARPAQPFRLRGKPAFIAGKLPRAPSCLHHAGRQLLQHCGTNCHGRRGVVPRPKIIAPSHRSRTTSAVT